MSNFEIIDKILDKYNVIAFDRFFLYDHINPVINHPEFQKRLTTLFMHHGDITLGEHIIEDAVVTYLNAKNKKNIDLSLALDISLFHDLYTVPWQNNKSNKAKKFHNKHGFRHPVEAVINASIWYPDYFKNDFRTEKLIDGIIHHMFPLPVVRIKSFKSNRYELKNYDLLDKVPDYVKDMILKSTNRFHLFNYSFCRSKYKEGRVLSFADKKVSLKQIKNVSSASALVTGKNKSIKSDNK